MEDAGKLLPCKALAIAEGVGEELMTAVKGGFVELQLSVVMGVHGVNSGAGKREQPPKILGRDEVP